VTHPTRTSPRHLAPRTAWLIVVCTVMFALLVATVEPQIYDTNFYSLWQSTALLAGDHPYRDFFEWGIPLQVGVSALAQIVLGPRLLSEFLVQWVGIVIGIGLTFLMACRLSNIPAALTTTLVSVLVVVATSTYHYPKFLFYPLALCVGWRYFNAPGLARAAVVGVVTALAFLFRHDHGVYAGLAAALTLGATVLSGRGPGGWRRLCAHVGAYVGSAALCILPWALLVQTGEGLSQYLTRRFAFYSGVTSVSGQFFQGSPFRKLLSTHPLSRLPGQEAGLLSLQQVALVIPLLLVAVIAFDARQRDGDGHRITPQGWLTLSAALFLIILDNQLFREPSYALMVIPLTLALGSQLLVRGWVARVGFSAILAITVAGVLGVVRDTPLGRPHELLTERVPRAFAQLLAMPPIDAFVSRVAAEQQLAEHGGDAWNLGTLTEGRHPLLRYLHDCTTAEDRVWLTGSTPFHVAYLIERRIAGGHIFWHQGWRSDPEGEAESLGLLRSTSVPFFFSANDPLLDDLKLYPRIREHVLRFYDEVPGTDGHLFVERARRPTGVFGPARFPCFANAP
jgi:hypothetical protein